MRYKTILNKVKSIILKHAEPERIWVYGSRASGDAGSASDIDVAYFDQSFRNDEAITEEIEKIDTLIKIDVKNIARAEKRFRERVEATGKPIFSATKKLRFEDSLHNFSRASERFREVLEDETSFAEEGFASYFPDIAIKRFEFTYETAWKALKRFLDYLGFDRSSPRACVKEAFAQGTIENELIWLDMIESRNLTSHIYDESEAKDILEKLKEFAEEFDRLKDKLRKELR